MKKETKRIILIVLAIPAVALLTLIIAIAGFFVVDAHTTKTGTLYINMGELSRDVDYNEYPFEYVGSPTPEKIAESLSTLTGLNFDITVTKYDKFYDEMYIDWSKDTTFFKAFDEIDQREEFYVEDKEALVWMMLDSLDASIWRNMSDINDISVFYSMDGGKELTFDVESLAGLFPVDEAFGGALAYVPLPPEEPVVEGDYVDRDFAFDIVHFYEEPYEHNSSVWTRTGGEGYEIIDDEYAYKVAIYIMEEGSAVWFDYELYAISESGKVYVYVKNNSNNDEMVWNYIKTVTPPAKK